MNDPEKRPVKLVPARPETMDDEAAAYMPRMPWRWIILGTLGVTTVMGGYWLKEHRRATHLRSQLERVHDQELAQASERYMAFRDKIEGWILEAGKGRPEEFVDKRLRIPGLRAGNGLYLRLNASHTDSKASIAKGAREMASDAIGACLGLAPASARALYDKGGFLEPDWLDDSREETSVMKLRVKDEVLARHIRADLPAVLSLLQSHWFMLVIQQGENRRDDPVDVFLWDLRSGDKLLSARVQSKGVLLPLRISAKGAPRAPRLPAERLQGAGAHDCSIASQLKALAGMPAATISSLLPGPDAGVADGGAGVQGAAAEETPEGAPASPPREAADETPSFE